MAEKNKAFGVIFDVDGTMVNNTSFHRQAWLDLTARYGMPLSEQDYHEKVHARSNDKIIRNLFGDNTTPETIQRIADEKEGLYRSSFAPHLKACPGLIELLEALKTAQIPCAAASNSPIGNVDFVLDGLAIRHFFKAVVNRDMVAVGKPHPELFLKAAEGLALPPDRCVVIEDSSSGFAAARAAGMKYIVITAGADPVELAQARDAAGFFPDFTLINAALLANL